MPLCIGPNRSQPTYVVHYATFWNDCLLTWCDVGQVTWINVPPDDILHVIFDFYVHRRLSQYEYKEAIECNRWFMSVNDGEALYFNHHIASICNFIVHPKHRQRTDWTSGQPFCLLLFKFTAIWLYRAWQTSLQHSSKPIVYLKSTSRALSNKWNRSSKQCGCHFLSWQICSLHYLCFLKFKRPSWVDFPHISKPFNFLVLYFWDWWNNLFPLLTLSNFTLFLFV